MKNFLLKSSALTLPYHTYLFLGSENFLWESKKLHVMFIHIIRNFQKLSKCRTKNEEFTHRFGAQYVDPISLLVHRDRSICTISSQIFQMIFFNIFTTLTTFMNFTNLNFDAFDLLVFFSVCFVFVVS